jgi:hypothetical protein
LSAARVGQSRSTPNPGCTTCRRWRGESRSSDRDGGADVVVLLVADTRHNRSVLRLARPDLAADFPLPGGAVLDALEAGRRPPAGGIVLL